MVRFRWVRWKYYDCILGVHLSLSPPDGGTRRLVKRARSDTARPHSPPPENIRPVVGPVDHRNSQLSGRRPQSASVLHCAGTSLHSVLPVDTARDARCPCVIMSPIIITTVLFTLLSVLPPSRVSISTCVVRRSLIF